MTFFITLACLQGCTLAIETPLAESGNGSIVTVLCACSAEMSSNAEAGGSGRLC
jgi:hypothetical protein